MSAPAAAERPGWAAGRTAAGVLVALAVAGCGGSAARVESSASGSATTHSSSTTHRAGPRPAAAVHVSGPPVGARQTLHADGADLTVTVLAVRALARTRSPSLPGTRQVGVDVRIADQAGQTYDSTASGDVSLVLSAGQAAPLDVRAGPCTTPLVDFESMIESGDVRSGCVGFSVPRAARVLGVRFSPHGRAPGTLSWRAR